MAAMKIVGLDLRHQSEPTDSLQAQLGSLPPDQQLLVRARLNLRLQLSQEWETWPLVDGPAAFYFLVGRPRPVRPPGLNGLRRRHQRLQDLYREAFALCLKGDAAGLERGESFACELLDYIRLERESIYPALDRWLGEQRPTRELSYEHQGLERALPRLTPALQACLAGHLTRKEREVLELDLLHLFEHHVERLEAGPLPWLERNAPAEWMERVNRGGPSPPQSNP